MVGRRKLAPVAVAIVGLAAIVVVVAVVAATRPRTARSASSAPASAPPSETTRTATEIPDAAVAAEVVAPQDAAIAVAAEPVRAPVSTKQKPTVTTQQPAGAPATVEPLKVEVPKLEGKKRCAKDDVECLYGDGT
jgi:hypothetical protein